MTPSGNRAAMRCSSGRNQGWRERKGNEGTTDRGKIKKALRLCRRAFLPTASERRFGGVQWLRGRGSFGLGFIAVELSHDIRANRPRSNLRRLRRFAFAVRLLVSRADEAALDEDVRTLLDRGEDVLGQPWTEDRDAMPLDFRDPFVFGIFPRALRGDGKNGEF